jgi:hypothetical protein
LPRIALPLATTDASIAIFDAEYADNFWRPVTAIRNADLRRNNATACDPTKKSW